MASLLKRYLRQLPEPLVPYSRYQEFLLCGQKLLSDRTQVRADALHSQDASASASSTAASHSPSLGPLPGSGRAEESSLRVAVFKLQLAQLHLPVRPPLPWVLRRSLRLLTFLYIRLSRFLYEVQSYSSSNRMSVQNLATVFGPNILRAKAEDPQSIVGGKRTAKQKPHFSSKFPSSAARS